MRKLLKGEEIRVVLKQPSEFPMPNKLNGKIGEVNDSYLSKNEGNVYFIDFREDVGGMGDGRRGYWFSEDEIKVIKKGGKNG